MARYAEHSGSGEHWLDGVSYHLIDRGPDGVGLVVQRTPPNAVPSTPARRQRVASKTRFFTPAFACPLTTGAAVEEPPPAIIEVPKRILRSITK
jgi:hypothetical protein